MIPTPPQPLALEFDAARGKWLMSFDASAYSNSACKKNTFFLIFRGLTSGRKDHKMEYGTAFHAAMAHYYTFRRHTMPPDTVKMLQAESLNKAMAHLLQPDIEIPEDDYRSVMHLLTCITQYYEFYAVEPLQVLTLGGKPLVEQKFSIPFYSDHLLEVSLTGTIDLAAHWCDQLVLVDHKTTAASSTRWYLSDYDLSSQLMMYTFIFGKLFPSLVDAEYGVGTMINGIFLRKSGKNAFERSSIRNFTPEQMDFFVRHLKETISGLAAAFHAWITGEDLHAFTSNFTQCHKKFSCPYCKLCLATEAERETIIKNEYVLRAYNPLLFQVAEGGGE